jgi:hypothetical protein
MVGVTFVEHAKTEYKPLAERVEEVRESMGSGEVYLAGAYYHIPSEIYYYEDGRFQGYTIIFQVYEHPVIRGGDNSYTPWTSSEELKGKDVIFVDSEKSLEDYSTPASYWEHKLPPYFESVEGPEVFSIRKPLGGERVFYIFKCRGFRGPDDRMNAEGEIREYVESNP